MRIGLNFLDHNEKSTHCILYYIHLNKQINEPNVNIYLIKKEISI